MGTDLRRVEPPGRSFVCDHRFLSPFCGQPLKQHDRENEQMQVLFRGIQTCEVYHLRAQPATSRIISGGRSLYQGKKGTS